MTHRRSLHLGALLLAGATALHGQDAWFDFDPDKDPFTDEAMLDLRHLNEEEAGDKGRIIVRGDNFAYEQSGQTVRFWAVNAHDYTWSAEDWREAARMLAKRGVNLVRFHNGIFYGKNKQGQPRWKIDQEARDGLFRAVAAMKAEGIYAHLSLYFPLWLRLDQDDERFPGFDGKTPPFMLHTINDDFESVYREWWTEALTTTNPHTGVTLAEDPAVMGLELVNEDSFFFWTFPHKNIASSYLQPLRKAFGAWAGERYGSVQAALDSWKGQRQKGDDPAAGELDFMHWSTLSDETDTQREKDTVRFLADYQRNWAKTTIDWLHEDIGYQGLITVSNWLTANEAKIGPIERWTYLDGDWIDDHAYFKNYAKGDHAGWSMRKGHIIGSRALSKMMPSDPSKGDHEYEVPWLQPTWNGMPTTVSETSWLATNRFRAEAPIYYAVYGANSGIDSIMNFALETKNWDVKPLFFMKPFNLTTPTQMGQFPAAAVMYRTGAISESPAALTFNLSEQDMFELQGVPMDSDGGIDALRAEEVGADDVAELADGFDPLLRLTGKIEINLGADGGHQVNPQALEAIDRDDQVVKSLSGQLALDWGKGLMTIDAPKAQGVVGFIGSNDRVELADISFSSELEFASMVAVSLDDRPLADSRKILVQVMTEEQPSGWSTRPRPHGLEQITNLGKNPWQAKKLEGTVQLQDAVTSITALDLNGYPRQVIGKGTDQFELLPDAIYYILER